MSLVQLDLFQKTEEDRKNEIIRAAIKDTVEKVILWFKNDPLHSLSYITGKIDPENLNCFGLCLSNHIRFTLRDNSAYSFDDTEMQKVLCSVICAIILEERNLIADPQQVYEYLESKES